MIDRNARLRRIAAMNPETEFTAIVRLMLDYEFPWDLYRSLELALFRTFAVPSIGRLLHRTGEFEQRPQKRYDDSVLMIHAMLYHGVQDEPGRAAVDRLNLIHGHYKISNEDFLYTLATFAVIPIRWIRDYGWRQPDDSEVRALTLAVAAMGRAMGIEDIPETFDDFERLLDDYEDLNFAHDEGASAVAATMVELVQSWAPLGSRRNTRLAILAVLDDRLAESLGLPVLPAEVKATARAGLRARATLVRATPPRRTSRPFVLTTRTYPNGFAISDLGPSQLVRDRA